MTAATVLAALVALLLLPLAVTAVRQRTLVTMALRNIRRRRGEAALVVAGALLTHLATTEIFLALHDGDGTTGDYSYTCPQCTRTGVHPATRTAVAELRSAGPSRSEGTDMSNTTATRPARTTMHAIVQHAYGTSDVLRLQDIDEPSLGPHDVLVGVHAASVNHGDWFVTSGRPYVARVALGLRRPRVAVRGRDLAGRVEAVGAAVTRFRPGDDVYAETTTGSFAELACVPERLLARKPANLTFEQAAAVPVAAVTALQGLRDVGGVQPGQAVLIDGASGGVGTFAVQIAKALGADVTGVCSTRNVELVRSLGAGNVIDYTREDFTRSGQRYDVILDLAGRHPLAALRGALTRTGTLVVTSGHGGPVIGPLGRYIRALAWSPFVTQRLRVHAAKPSRSDLDAVTALIEVGVVTPAVEATYALAETAEAIRHLNEEHARAKLVITVHGSHAARDHQRTKETEDA